MSKKNFLKHIQSLEEEELRQELKLLYSKIKDVKLHYAMELGDIKDREKIIDKSKKEIRYLFFIKDKARKRPRIQKTKNNLKEIISHAVFTHEKIDIYLYTVEVNLAYLYNRPRTTAAAYNNCVQCFSKAIDLIDQYVMKNDFVERCQAIVQDSEMFYSITEEMSTLFNQVFE